MVLNGNLYDLYTLVYQRAVRAHFSLLRHLKLKHCNVLVFFFLHQELPFNCYFPSPRFILLCVRFAPAAISADKLTFLSSTRTLREVNKIWETTLACVYLSQITVMLNELLLIIHCSRIWFTFS